MDDGDEKPKADAHDDRSPSSSESTGATANKQDDHARHMSLPRDIAFITTICLAQILSLGALAQTLVPLPYIAHDLGLTNPSDGSWLSAAFSLTAGTFILPAGRLGDIFGLKRMYIIGFLFFAFWTFMAGFSVYGGFVMLSVCRGLQGIGSAIVVPNAMALVGTVYWHPSQEKKKHLSFAMFGASAPTGFVVGALFSTILAQFAWWPWGFWVEAIVLFANAVSAYFVIPPDSILDEQGKKAAAHAEKEESSDASEQDSDEHILTEEKNSKVEFDYWGCLTGVTGLVLFGFAWNQAPIVTWSSPYIITVLIIGVLSLVAFYFVETRYASQPLVPFSQMNSKTRLTLFVLAAGWGSFGIWTFYFFQLQQIIRGYLPLSTVAQDSAAVPAGICAALITGYLLSRTNISNILLIATCCFLTGQVLMGTQPVDQSFWIQTFLSLIIMPFGMDMSFPSGTALVSAGMPVRYQGTASSLVDTVVNYSISLGLGFAGTISKNVGGELTEDLTNAGPPGPMGQAGLYPGGDEAKTLAFLRGYRASFYFGIGLDVIGVVIALGFVASDWVVQRRKDQSGGDGEAPSKKAASSVACGLVGSGHGKVAVKD